MALPVLAIYERGALTDVALQEEIEAAWLDCLNHFATAAEIADLLGTTPADLAGPSPVVVAPPQSHIGVVETLIVIGLKAYGVGILKGVAGAAGVASGSAIWTRFIAPRIRTAEPAALGPSRPVPPQAPQTPPAG